LLVVTNSKFYKSSFITLLDMPQRISEETVELMQTLYVNDGLPVAEVARKVNLPYSTVYVYTKAKERGFANLKEYEQHLARERGFANLKEYEQHLARERQQKPLNQELSYLIQERLTELEKSQKWLSVQLGITEGAVSRYVSGRTRPRISLQPKLFEALELPYQTLDDLVSDIELE
jgi:predicted DNA-binding protein YlxM (UPF0122 family)